MLDISPSILVRCRSPFPIKIANIIIVIPMLIVCPTNRMVPKVAEAIPYSGVLTELITALVLGEENSANPSPNSMRISTINKIPVSLSRNINGTIPKAVIAMPMDATMAGSILSLSFPARGEKIVIIIG